MALVVTVAAEDLAHVIRLASLVESRSNQEQRALLNVAAAHDVKANGQHKANITPSPGAMWQPTPEGELERIKPESKMELLAHTSRVMEEKGERLIRPSWMKPNRGHGRTKKAPAWALEGAETMQRNPPKPPPLVGEESTWVPAHLEAMPRR